MLLNNTSQVGQWYTCLDTKEVFLVTGYDDKSCTIETLAINGDPRSINGDLDEIDAENWNMLPLAARTLRSPQSNLAPAPTSSINLGIGAM